jgi:hypothetical protein
MIYTNYIKKDSKSKASQNLVLDKLR